MAEPRTASDLWSQRPGFSGWLAVVLLFAIFALAVWVLIGASPRGTDYEQKRAEGRVEKLKKSHDEWNTALTTYAWVDKGKGTARIPIDQAMRITVTELAQKKPAPANPIAPEAQPGGSQQNAPVTAPQASPPPAPAASTTPNPISIEGPKSEIRGQRAGEANPAPAPPGTQPGPNATPAASPPPGSRQPNPAGTPQSFKSPTPVGTPLPVRGKKP